MSKRYKWGPFGFYKMYMTTYEATHVEYTVRFEYRAFRMSASIIRPHS